MIYLDHHAATPVCAAALRAMDAARAQEPLGNPASVHAAGRAARALLERAREQVAAAIGAKPADVVLTSGGTEACNLGVRGALDPRERAHVVTSAVEHPAVAATLAQLRDEQRVEVTELPVPEGHAPSQETFAAALRPEETRLVALQWVNHETGTVLPVADYAATCRRVGVPLFVDATQALGADLIALASHKLGGPAGAGALRVRRGLPLAPLILGGAQERGRRGGTPDVVSAAGFGAACAELPARLAAQPRLAAMRARLESEVRALGGVINGAAGTRVAGVVNASFEGRRGPDLVAALDLEGVCVSSGAACSSGLDQPSPVLLAMHGTAPWRAGAALRFSFGPETSDADVETALRALRKVLARGRG